MKGTKGSARKASCWQLAEKKILRRRKQLRKAVKMTSQQRAEGFKESERPERAEGSETNRAETSKQTDKITDN
jgi:hypothetical protein